MKFARSAESVIGIVMIANNPYPDALAFIGIDRVEIETYREKKFDSLPFVFYGNRGINMKITLPEKYASEPTGLPFSPVLSIEGTEIVVTAGTCCDDYDGQIPEDLETQARNTILACERALKEAGCGLENVFNVEVYMNDLVKWNDFNKVYRELMPSSLPCRKALQVGLLQGYQVEMVMWAVK